MCGEATTRRDEARIEADIGRLRYLLDELRGWVGASLIGGEFADRLAGPYRSELACAELYRERLDSVFERPLAPACHDTPVQGLAFCPDCGVDLVAWRAERTTAALPATVATTINMPIAVTEPASATSEPASAVFGPPLRTGEPEPVAPPAARRGRRLLRELRPVFYENLILFLGAFLMFAGSIYFAVYFWDRFGLLGPLVAGGLLAIYGLSFAGVGYLLQRRYRAELSARVLYAVATAILPVASTLLGEPIRTQSAGIAILSAGIVIGFGAATYPITHGSRAHAYLAATAAVFVLPAAVAALGHGGDMIGVALAGGAVLAVIGARAIARRPAFAASVERGDLPLRLFGHWPLPSAATHCVLWQPPVRALGLAAAFAAAALALEQAIAAWPAGSAPAAATCALLAAYAVARCIETVDARLAAALAAHAACAVIALLSAEIAQLLGRAPHGVDLVVFGAGFLVISEAIARSSQVAARAGGRAALIWSIAALLLPVTVLAQPGQPITPVAAAILAVAVIRVRQRHPMTGARTAASIATTAAGGFLVLWLLARIDWLVPIGVACSALAVTAALAAWLHWALRRPANLGEPFRLIAAWAAVGTLLALASALYTAPASVPALLPAVLALAALALATAWFAFAAIRTARDRHGYAAHVALVLLYVAIRTGPLGTGITAETDAIVAIAASFALHFTSELLQRAGLTALERPAVVAARTLPLAACIVVLGLASSGGGNLSTLEHAVLAETLGVLYTLGARRTGHRALGLVAIAFYNLGLALLWLATDQRDPLFYVVPLGLSISLLARIYRSHMTRAARRGLRASGALLIYFATYYQVIQFDHSQYALWLGVFTLAGIALGFWLQLRELFLLSIGFLVLDVTSNLAYYGVHRPVLGWTLLTLAGLCLTVSGIVFQLRRSQVRGLLANARATMADWD